MTGTRRKEPLYRRVNTRTHGVHHGVRQEARWDRNTKAALQDERMRGSMHPGRRLGLDHTPLFRFLLSRVGQDWDAIHSEAVARLDCPDPIFRMVARSEEARRPYIRSGESSYFSGLYVDEENRLRKVAPELDETSLAPSCPCCTHTFNGKRYTRRYPGHAAD